jgi:uncharacterized membrane protein
MRVVPCFALVAVAVAGCAEDLGTCQMNAATQVVYAGNGTPYYAGQALVQASCAEGVCHSAYAANASRKGAPFGLNFDVAPLSSASTPANVSALRDGISHVRDHASSLWGEIAAGTMPPGEAGNRGEQQWKALDADGNAQVTPLTNITSDVAKSTVRNWLACGAPLVAGVSATPDAMALGEIVAPLENMSTDGPTFENVYNTVLSSCKTCHPGAIKVDIDFTSLTTAFNTLVGKAAFAGGAPGMCGAVTQKLVTPGNCQESLLYLKLRANPPCGDQMPLGPPLPDASIQLLCDWIDAGATM